MYLHSIGCSTFQDTCCNSGGRMPPAYVTGPCGIHGPRPFDLEQAAQAVVVRMLTASQVTMAGRGSPRQGIGRICSDVALRYFKCALLKMDNGKPKRCTTDECKVKWEPGRMKRISLLASDGCQE